MLIIMSPTNTTAPTLVIELLPEVNLLEDVGVHFVANHNPLQEGEAEGQYGHRIHKNLTSPVYAGLIPRIGSDTHLTFSRIYDRDDANKFICTTCIIEEVDKVYKATLESRGQNAEEDPGTFFDFGEYLDTSYIFHRYCVTGTHQYVTTYYHFSDYCKICHHKCMDSYLSTSAQCVECSHNLDQDQELFEEVLNSL